jgi:hypothetical protein
MRKQICAALLVLALAAAQPAFAWWNGGHEVVAYIAYQKLTPATRARVDALLKLNPMYGQWTHDVEDSRKPLVAFLMAATWPDCIKSPSCAAGYTSDGGNTPPGNPTDDQNIGYSDKLMHQYWHFVDEPYSAGAPGQPPKVPNALTEIEKLSAAIGTDEPDDVKSYDVVWLEHLVGDIHQPLHATSRFTANHPQGDAGGNLVYFCNKPCTDELHAYWDGLLGDGPTVEQITDNAKTLLRREPPAGADSVHAKTWVNQSFSLAKSAVYAAPISSDNDPSVTLSPRPDAAYSAEARKVADAQILLAGYRLAALLNRKLK